MRWLATLLVGLLGIAVVISAGCGRAVQVPAQDIEDARLGVRIKTALVNDPRLGPRVIEVRVTGGVAVLSGLVASEAEVTRALELARAVPGVAEARSQLTIGDPAARPRPQDQARRDPSPVSATGQRGLLAVGASINTRQPTSDTLSSTVSLWPLVRIGRSEGLGLSTGFGWFDTEVTSAGVDLGRVNVRPVMGGLAYTFTDRDRWALDVSLVGGLSFNSVDVEDARVREGQVIDVDNSLAMRPGVSLWYDLNNRLAVNLFGGYVITRPQTTFLERGEFTRRSARFDTTVLSVGLAYKLF